MRGMVDCRVLKRVNQVKMRHFPGQMICFIGLLIKINSQSWTSNFSSETIEA